MTSSSRRTAFAAAALLGASGALHAQEPINVVWKNGLYFQNDDKSVNVKLGGRLHADWAWLDTSSGAAIDDAGGNEFRRARIYLGGTISENVEFKTQYDFAGSTDVGFRDMWIGLRDLPGIGKLRFGQMMEPFGLEQLTSSNYHTFMERSLVDGFVPGRKTGVMATNTAAGDDLQWAVGIFRDGSDGDSGNADNEGEGAITARVTHTPVRDDDGLVHVGLAASWRSPEDGMVQFRNNREIHLGDRLADTGVLADVDSVFLLGPEAAWICGPFSLQGEYRYADVDSTTAGDPSFHGYYVQTTYTLTGESRSYKTSSGSFGGITPKDNYGSEGGCGAWELAARYSKIDLDGPNGVDGVTFGVNWYLNPNTRVLFNLVRTDQDGGDDIEAAQARLQFNI